MSAFLSFPFTVSLGERHQILYQSNSCVDGRWLSLKFFNAAHADDIWKVCFEGTQANLQLFYRVYRTWPLTSSEFLSSIFKPPPGSTDALLSTFVDRSDRKVLGFAVIYGCDNNNERLSAIFMPLRGIPAPFERAIDAFHILWEYAVETLGLHRVQTRAVHDTDFGLPDHRTFFGFIGVVKRSLMTESTKDVDTYTITKEHWPIVSEASSAWLYGRGLSASNMIVSGVMKEL